MSPPDSTPCAVVVGLDCMTGLQSARILDRRGVPVIGIAGDPRHPCCRTRSCREVLQADINGPELIDCLRDLGRRLSDKAVLYPCTDLSVLAISRHRAELVDRFHVVMPPHDVVVMLMDKIRFFEFAAARGFSIPPGAIVGDAQQARLAADRLELPCVVKPAVRTPLWQAHSKAKVYKVRTPDELVETVEKCLAWTDRLLVQEWVQGGDENSYTCNCVLTRQGKSVASFTSRKLRQWPPQTGIGCLSVESRNDVVREETIRLFERVGFHGLAYVEMKIDERTGQHFIIEPNVARPTGRSAAAEAAGVELLYTMYCEALGRPLPPNRFQNYSGVKWIHLRQDIRSAWVHWRSGELSLAGWWASWRGKRVYAVFSWSDPRPFLGDLAKVVRRAVGKIGQKHKGQLPLPQ